MLDKSRDDVALDELTRQMAGGDELAELSHKLKKLGGMTSALETIETRS